MASIQSGKSMQPVISIVCNIYRFYIVCKSVYWGKNQVGAVWLPSTSSTSCYLPSDGSYGDCTATPLPREKDILLNASSKRAPNRYYTLTNFDSCMHLLKTNCFCATTHLFLLPYKFYSLAIKVTFEHDHIPPIK